MSRTRYSQANMMNIGVVLLSFNRPALARRVFGVIKQAQPTQLLLVSDGPRPNHPEDVHLVAATRAILSEVDWPCELHRAYADTNMGVGDCPASGLFKAFSLFEAAIILEDDCLPDPTFFPYCYELLERYLHDDRVMFISGNNIGLPPRAQSYAFTTYGLGFGWASWRRAFKYYDPTMGSYKDLRNTKWLENLLGDAHVAEFWRKKFDAVYTEGIKVHGWDWPWLYALWSQGGLSITPNSNLVSNIGFTAGSTHPFDPNSPLANVPLDPMRFPLVHPRTMIRDTELDRLIAASLGLRMATWKWRLRNKFRNAIFAVSGSVKKM